MASLTLLTKPGCHLCDVAREVMISVIGTLAEPDTVTVEEISILDDPELLDRYAEEIPVLLIDGRIHTIYRIDAARLRAALQEE